MKHLGDITKINGAEIEVVDGITGGSPCQDLSIAGKRAGLAGARSGLFMEQVRIVKEMREHDRKSGRTGDMVRPRFMVWENVPGAFSSNKGRDFAAVLEEIIRIAEPEAPDIEVPEKGWNTWGGYHDEVGGRWSVAWRVHDAQHWGVPQRRRRISVVADFGGDTAGEILFERKSVSGYLTESGAARERLTGDSESGAGRTGESIAHAYGETGVGYWKNGVQTLRAEGENRPSRPSNVVVCMATQQGGAELRTDDRSPTLTAMVVRRLTPMECERLQGYPDGWTDIGEWRDSKGKLRKPSDSPRYKACGNSIALPFWDFLAKRISAQYLRPVTMGSLFDGIGGFPLVFERHNGKGTARWASEIEEFPIAVTKLRFGEEV